MDPCAYPLGLCQCREESPMIHHGNASYYPKSGCFRMGRILFTARSIRMGRHFWDLFIHLPPGTERRITPCPLYTAYHITLTTLTAPVVTTETHPVRKGMAIMFEPHLPSPNLPIRRVMPMIFVWRIQRAIRSFLRRKWEERALAVMMALHPRLGLNSHLAGVPGEVLKCICKQ